MKKTYLTIIYLVTAIICIGAFLSRTGISEHFFWWKASGDSGRSGELSDTISLSSFSSVDMDMSVADLTFESGESSAYEIFYKAKSQTYIPQIEQSKDTLKIRQKVKKTNQNSSDCEIIIRLPKGSSLSLVDIATGVGDLTFDGLTIKEMDLDAGVGDIQFKNSQIENLSMNAGVGNVVMYKNMIQELKIKAGLGNVEISEIGELSEYHFDIEHGMGSLTVGGQTISGLGRDYTQSGSSSKKITIEAGMGNVTIR